MQQKKGQRVHKAQKKGKYAQICSNLHCFTCCIWGLVTSIDLHRSICTHIYLSISTDHSRYQVTKVYTWPNKKSAWCQICLILCRPCLTSNDPSLSHFPPPDTLQYTTPSVPNYKSFQEYWRVKPSQSLTKIIERNTKIYDIKQVYYENIANKESNDT